MKILACLLLSLGASLLHGGESLPEGPPWHRELRPALAEALEQEKPIFAYFTKTY